MPDSSASLSARVHGAPLTEAEAARLCARLADAGTGCLDPEQLAADGAPRTASPCRAPFAAPECGEACARDEAARVYNLAALWHLCLVGRPPRRGRPDIFALEAATVGRDSQRLLLRCLAPEPQDRPALASLRAAWAAAPPPPRRGGRGAFALLVAAVSLAAGALLWTWASPAPLRTRTVAGLALVELPAGTVLIDGRSVTLTRPYAIAREALGPAQATGLGVPADSALSWFDAVAVCNALSARAGLDSAYVLGRVQRDPAGRLLWAHVDMRQGARGFRLPTEAEWEAARQRLGALPPAVWCGDRYGPALPAGVDPRGPERGSQRVLAGGAPGERRPAPPFAAAASVRPVLPLP